MLPKSWQNFLDRIRVRPIYRSILLKNKKAEIELCPFILERLRPSDTVVEAGAFLGQSTRILAKKVKLVYAFEPDKLYFSKLIKKLDRNVIPINEKLSDITDESTIRLALFANVLILDVEGDEIKVLKGAKFWLEGYRLVFVEVHDRYKIPTKQECLKILSSCGFKTQIANVTYDDWIIAENQLIH